MPLRESFAPTMPHTHQKALRQLVSDLVGKNDAAEPRRVFWRLIGLDSTRPSA
jgi:hypothetical protein